MTTTPLAHARELLRRHILIDGHNDLPWAIHTADAPDDLVAYDLRKRTPGQTDDSVPTDAELRIAQAQLVGWLEGLFHGIQTALFAQQMAARAQLEQIDLARRMIARYPRRLELCWSAREVREAFERGRIASLLGMEGGHVIENSLGALRSFHELGARYLTLTHNQSTDWADSATDSARHGGLTPFGREVVAEMNRLGMLVDLSHVAPTTMRDALDTSEAPVIFSHSSARAVCDVPRNVPDEILQLVPSNGGVVMVTFVAGFVSPAAAAMMLPAIAKADQRLAKAKDPAARRAVMREVFESLEVPLPPVSMVADHVEHIARTAGVDHVGLGGDFDGSYFQTDGLADVSGYPNLFAELIRRGWSDGDLARLAGANVLRVMGEAEAVAARLKRRTSNPAGEP